MIMTTHNQPLSDEPSDFLETVPGITARLGAARGMLVARARARVCALSSRSLRSTRFGAACPVPSGFGNADFKDAGFRGTGIGEAAFVSVWRGGGVVVIVFGVGSLAGFFLETGADRRVTFLAK